MNTIKTKRSKTRQDTGVKKGHFALFWNKSVISGECRFTAKKYADGQVIFEITYTTTMPKKKKH